MAIQVISFKVPHWPIEEETGYKPQTTFWQDFSIADKFGTGGVQDTYDKAFAEWKGNYIYLTELVMVLNWKIWQHYDRKNPDKPLPRLYDRLWREADEYAQENLKGNELDYYYTTTD